MLRARCTAGRKPVALVFRDSRAIVVHADNHRVVWGRSDADEHVRTGVLQRVLDKIRNDLPEPLRVHDRGDGFAGLQLQLHVPVASQRVEAFDGRPHHVPCVDGARRKRELVRVQPREVEEVRDQALEALGLAHDDACGPNSIGLGIDRPVGHGLAVTPDRRQWGPEVVRDAQQERSLVAASALELFSHRVDAPGEARQLII